jgi:hypothetical protein
VNLNRTPRSLGLRTLRRRIRRVWRQPLAGLVGREPETIVRVPPIDAPFLAALKLIAPQYGSLGPDEPSRLFWERDQNSSCWAEDAALAPVFAAMPRPSRILEIGPGLGRSCVFWSKRYFPDAHFDLYDATGHDTKYELLGNRYEDSFCGNLDILERCVAFNGVKSYRVIDASTTGGHIPAPDRPYDLIYSFYAVGFHWSLDHWLDEILSVAHDATVCAFLVPSHYQPSPRIARMPHVMLESSPPLRPKPWNTSSYFLVFTPKPVAWLPL